MAAVRGTPSLNEIWSMKGRALVKSSRGGKLIVTGWPKKRGKQAPNVERNIQAFVLAQQMMKQLPARQIAVAYELTAKTGMYPRDALFSAMFGNMVEVISLA